MKPVEDSIDDFLAAPHFAVVGASTLRSKYGNKVLRSYLQAEKPVTPINPRVAQVEGLDCLPSLTALGRSDVAVSVITPPAITERVIEECGALGISRVWLQPGAESEIAISRAEALGIDLIHSGPCLLVKLGYRESA